MLCQDKDNIQDDKLSRFNFTEIDKITYNYTRPHTEQQWLEDATYVM